MSPATTSYAGMMSRHWDSPSLRAPRILPERYFEWLRMVPWGDEPLQPAGEHRIRHLREGNTWAFFHVEALNVLGGNSEAKCDRDDAACGCPGDEIEVIDDPFTARFFDAGQDGGAVGASDAATIETEIRNVGSLTLPPSCGSAQPRHHPFPSRKPHLVVDQPAQQPRDHCLRYSFTFVPFTPIREEDARPLPTWLIGIVRMWDGNVRLLRSAAKRWRFDMEGRRLALPVNDANAICARDPARSDDSSGRDVPRLSVAWSAGQS